MNYGVIKVLWEGTHRLGYRVTLEHHSAGIYIAGSGTRVQEADSYLARVYRPDGTTSGRYYRNREDAEQYFTKVTTK